MTNQARSHQHAVPKLILKQLPMQTKHTKVPASYKFSHEIFDSEAHSGSIDAFCPTWLKEYEIPKSLQHETEPLFSSSKQPYKPKPSRLKLEDSNFILPELKKLHEKSLNVTEEPSDVASDSDWQDLESTMNDVLLKDQSSSIQKYFANFSQANPYKTHTPKTFTNPYAQSLEALMVPSAKIQTPMQAEIVSSQPIDHQFQIPQVQEFNFEVDILFKSTVVEFVRSEIAYLQELEFITNVYLKNLKNHSNKYTLDDSKANIIFNEIPSIITLSRKLLGKFSFFTTYSAIIAQIKKSSKLINAGEIFLSHFSDNTFQLVYKYYTANAPAQQNMLRQLLNSHNNKFMEWYNESTITVKRSAVNQDLESLIIKPTQRLAKYKEFINKLILHAEATIVERERTSIVTSLIDARTKLVEISNQISSSKINDVQASPNNLATSPIEPLRLSTKPAFMEVTQKQPNNQLDRIEVRRSQYRNVSPLRIVFIQQILDFKFKYETIKHLKSQVTQYLSELNSLAFDSTSIATAISSGGDQSSTLRAEKSHLDLISDVSTLLNDEVLVKLDLALNSCDSLRTLINKDRANRVYNYRSKSIPDEKLTLISFKKNSSDSQAIRLENYLVETLPQYLELMDKFFNEISGKLIEIHVTNWYEMGKDI